MTAEVEHGERADVADAINVHRELAEEIDDRASAGGQGEEEDAGGEEDGKEFGEEDGDFQGK